MEDILFLDPTPRELCSFSEAVRHRVYRRIGTMVRDAVQHPRTPHHPPAKRISILTIAADYGQLEVAFTSLRDSRLAILAVGRTPLPMLQELESRLDALAHIDSATMGLQVSKLPAELDASVKVMDGAVYLYCRARNWAYHSRPSHTEAIQAIDRLIASVPHVWGSSEARSKFRNVLDQAERDPQLIERGDRRFLLVEESRLSGLMDRKNAAEMYRLFFEELEPLEPFERIKGRAPGRLLDLT